MTGSADLPGAGSELPAGRPVTQYLHRQMQVLLAPPDALWADEPDAVHQARVATRRLRSALRTFGPLFDPDHIGPLADDLKWWGTMLGAARDGEVLADRLVGQAKALPADLVPAATTRRLTDALGSDHAAAHARLVAQFGTERHERLVEQLRRFDSDPPLTQAAHHDARRRLPPLLRRAHRRVARPYLVALLLDGPERILAFHEVRKRAKAARYAYDAVGEAFGAPATAAATRWEAVTESLGDAQDGALAVERLGDLAAQADTEGEPTFGFGVLVAEQLRAGDVARRHAVVHLAAALAITEPFRSRRSRR